MLEVTVPGRGELVYEHLVLDFNGTLALDGALLPGVAEQLEELSADLTVHVITADTFGTAAAALSGLPLRLEVLGPGVQGEAKAEAVRKLGAARTVAVGNGSNDAAMLESAGLGIIVCGPEGMARESLLAADLVAPDIRAALDLLLKLERLVATRRL